MSDAISFKDCCRMILEDWIFRQDSTTQEWRDYFRHRLALLNQEFGIAWTDGGSREMKGIPFVAVHMPKTYDGFRDPMFATLEYNYKPGECDAHDYHLGPIADAERVLKERWVAFFHDLLLLRWPEAANRTTSWSRLHTLGLGEEPDTSVT